MPAREDKVTHDEMADAIRALAMDAVENAKSGHPGPPMGAADIATVLFTKVLKYDAAAALMGIRAIEVFTHDSIGRGEDGPMHQPVEHLAALRAIPSLRVFQPADRTETLECWQLALQAKTSPSVLALTRQNLPSVRGDFSPENLSAAGAYELAPADGRPAKVSIFASGSEISIALEARTLMAAWHIPTRVVSVPCMTLFLRQDRDWRQKLIGDAPVRVGVEAAIRQGSDAIIGEDGIFIGMTGFGASAPSKDAYNCFNIKLEASPRLQCGVATVDAC